MDTKKWLKNALIFFAPVAIIYLVFLSGNMNDGVQLHDFVPNAVTQGAMMLYIINTLLDFLRKVNKATNDLLQGGSDNPTG